MIRTLLILVLILVSVFCVICIAYNYYFGNFALLIALLINLFLLLLKIIFRKSIKIHYSVFLISVFGNILAFYVIEYYYKTNYPKYTEWNCKFDKELFSLKKLNEPIYKYVSSLNSKLHLTKNEYLVCTKHNDFDHCQYEDFDRNKITFTDYEVLSHVKELKYIEFNMPGEKYYIKIKQGNDIYYFDIEFFDLFDNPHNYKPFIEKNCN